MLGIGGGHRGDAIDKLRGLQWKPPRTSTPADRDGLAKKYGISELMPLLAMGIEQMDAFTARAKELGLVMSETDAQRRQEVRASLRRPARRAQEQRGADRRGLDTADHRTDQLIVPVVVAVRDWIKHHQDPDDGPVPRHRSDRRRQGLPLKGLAVVTGIASKAITVLQWAVKGVSLAFNVFSSVIGWLPMLANPWVLAGIAIAGVVVWIATLSGAFDGLGALWKGMTADFADSFGAISNALAKGDIQAAWNVIVALF